MAEYIEREELLKRLDMAIDCKNCPRCVDMKTYYDRCAYTDIQDVCGIISDIPTADVQPVKHGRWIITDDVEHFIAVCSECGRTEDSRCIKDMPYCHCGARMDGDTNG